MIEKLESYNDNYVIISKIIVSTQRNKDQLLAAFKYIHDLRNIDSN